MVTNDDKYYQTIIKVNLIGLTLSVYSWIYCWISLYRRYSYNSKFLSSAI